MCKLRLLLVSALLTASQMAAAQTPAPDSARLATPPTRAALEARLAELKQRARELKQQRDSLRAAQADSGLEVSIREGALELRTTKALRAAASVALPQAVAVARATLGAEFDSLSRTLRLTLKENRQRMTPSGFFAGDTSAARWERTVSASLVATKPGAQIPGVAIAWPVTSPEVRDGLLALMARAAAADLPPALATWIGNSIPLDSASAEYHRSMRRWLYTADANAARQCLAGDIAQCRLGLAIDSMPIDPVRAWYVDGDLPNLARWTGDGIQRSWMNTKIDWRVQEECTVRSHLPTCRDMLALLPPEAFHIPISSGVRAEILSLALLTGGEGAFDRLVHSRQPSIAGQLSEAARVPEDSLIRRWHARVAGARANAGIGDPVALFSVVLCLALCGGVAMRGKPWS